MLTNSQDIKRRLEREGWTLRRVKGSHHVFKREGTGLTPSEEGLICKPDGTRIEAADMPHYVAIVEDAGPEKAVGIWFPDLPGCFSAGDDVDEALRNTGEAIELYAEEIAKDGRHLPPPRTVSELKSDVRVAEDLKDHLIALVQAPQSAQAAE